MFKRAKRWFWGLLCLLLIFIYTSQRAWAQRNRIWYFGANAGLDFDTSPPTALTDGALNNTEGCAAICDEDGNLLFYTNGITVWNRNHQVMVNGNGLLGHPSATQAGVIIPYPGNSDLYYVFTVQVLDVDPNAGVTYSLVDMGLQGGLGEVTSKNNLLSNPTTEKITAVLHENGQDVWVLVHLWDSDAFHAYLITDTGISTTPVVSNVGSVHTLINSNATGYMRISPDGSRLALVMAAISNKILEPNFGFLEIFNFDPATGIVGPRILQTNADYFNIYGIEFSPDSRKLYWASSVDIVFPPPITANEIFQAEMSDDSVAIINSIQSIASIPSSTLDEPLGAFQLGPDGRIYIARPGKNFLGLITDPNLSGTAANFVLDGVDLNGPLSLFGLPNYIVSFDALGVVLRSSQAQLFTRYTPIGIELSLSLPEGQAQDLYALERSVDGITVETLQTFPLADIPQSFYWIDSQIPSGVPVIFYRLNPLDRASSPSPWQAVAIASEASRPLVMYPNPLPRGQALHLYTDIDTDLQEVIVSNGKGQSKRLPVQKVEPGLYQFTSSTLSSGLYTLWFVGQAGYFQGKFIVY